MNWDLQQLGSSWKQMGISALSPLWRHQLLPFSIQEGGAEEGFITSENISLASHGSFQEKLQKMLKKLPLRKEK